jgi:hypothetical protein
MPTNDIHGHRSERMSMSTTSPRAKPAVEALIPRPRVIKGQVHFVEAEANNYLRALAGLDPLPIDAKAPVRLIRLSTLAERRDRCPRTIKREVERVYGRIDGTVEPTAATAKQPRKEPIAPGRRVLEALS